MVFRKEFFRPKGILKVFVVISGKNVLVYNKYRTVQELCSIFSNNKSINIVFGLVWFR